MYARRANRLVTRPPPRRRRPAGARLASPDVSAAAHSVAPRVYNGTRGGTAADTSARGVSPTHGPGRAVVQHERVHPRQPQRLFRGHRGGQSIVVIIIVVAPPAEAVTRADPSAAAAHECVVSRDVDGQQLLDDTLTFQSARQIFTVRVGLRGGELECELQQTL